MVAMVVAVGYVETQVPAMVAATDWRQFAFELDEVAVKMNEEKVEVCLEVVMIVEETPKPPGESDVLWVVVASVKNVQPWAEIDDSLQEQRQMKLALELGFGVSLEEFGLEIHLLDPENHLAQAITEQAECLAAVLAVLTAECFAVPLAELLEPRSKQFFNAQISTNRRS